MRSEVTAVTLKTAAILLLTAIAVAGCGVRGALDAPQASTGSTSTTAQAESGQGKKAGDAPKPHQGFILDKLIQ
jgi:predicted small lipoprotein YifL